MARPLRIQYPGAFYHVMNRGANRQPIFLDAERDRGVFMGTLEQAVNVWKIKIHAYALMDNHYHLLIETPLPNLSRAMRHIDGVYTQKINRLLNRDGPLLRGRFKSILVQKESYFLELVRYIHLNGVKAGGAQSPESDPNCSHRQYLQARPPGWLTVDLALSHFDQDPNVARQKLHAFVMQGAPLSIDALMTKERWPAILGEKEFVSDMRDRFRLGKPPHPEKPQELRIVKLLSKTPEEALQMVQMRYDVTRDDLVSRYERRATEARQAAMFVLRFACHFSYARIGKELGGIRCPAVSHAIKQIRQKNSDRFNALIETLS